MGASAAGLLWLATATVALDPATEADPNFFLIDYFHYYRPNGNYLGDRLAAGELPLWNPHHGLGGPFLATTQPGVLYPPNWLSVFVEYQTASVALLALHFALASFFCSRLAAAHGASPVSALLAGLLFALSGRMRWSILQPTVVFASAWLPAILLAIHRAVRSPGRGVALGLGLAVALQILAGYPQGVLITGLAASLYTLALLAQRAYQERRVPWPALACLAVGVLTALCFAAPQLGPSYELLQRSVRASGTLGKSSILSMGSVPFWTFSFQGVDWMPGVAAFALCPLALLGREPARLGVWALLLAGALCALASVPDSAVFNGLTHVPMLGDVRFPARYRLVPTLIACVLAGLGLDFVLSWAPAWLRPRQLALAAAACAVLAGPLSGIPIEVPLARASSGYPTPERRVAARLGSALDGQLHRVYWNQAVERIRGDAPLDVAFDYEPLTIGRVAAALNFVQTGWPVEISIITGPPYSEPPVSPFPFFGLLELPETPDRFAIFDALSIDLFVVPSGDATPTWLKVGRTMMTAPPSGWPAQPPPAWVKDRLEMLNGEEPPIYRNPRALPRAYWVARAEPEPPDLKQALERLIAPDFDLHSTVLIDELPDALPAPSADTPAFAPVEVYRHDPHRVTLVSNSAQPGIVVLTDAYYPGWRATVDGQPAPLHRVNALVRGVVVPAGRHVIRMRYRPASFSAGVALAGVGSTAWIAVGVALYRRRRARVAEITPAPS